MILSRRSILLASLALFFTVSLAEAQTSVRFYVVPKLGDGLTLNTAFRPKYIADGGIAGSYTAMDYGSEDLMLVGANVTPAENTTISANADVLTVPAALDDNVSSLALTKIQTQLEAGHLPTDWVTTSLTYRQVLKGVAALVLIRQRYQGMFGDLFTGGVTLDLRINQIPTQTRINLNTAAQSLGLDTSGITNTMLLRTALKLLANQMPSIVLMGETL